MPLLTQDAYVACDSCNCHSTFSSSAVTRVDFCTVNLQLHVDVITTGTTQLEQIRYAVLGHY